MGSYVTVVANQKGGVGKTTTAISLAAGIAKRDHNVLLIDLDPQANATSGLGCTIKPGASIYGVLLGEAPLTSRIVSTSVPNLDLVPSEVDLAGAEIDIARGDNYLHRFREILQPLRDSGRYELIMVDCPPSLGILTMNALTAADSLLIPLQCEYYALEGLSVIVSLVEKLRGSGANPYLMIEGIVMTMYDIRTKLAAQVVAEVQKFFPEKIYETMIPRSVRISEAPSHGMPVTLYEPNCAGAQAYDVLAEEFLARRKKIADAPPVDI